MKSKIFQTKTLVVLGFLFALSIPANAQFRDITWGTWNNPVSASIGTLIWSQIHANAGAQKSGGSSSSSSTTAKRTADTAPAPPKKSAAQIAAATRFRSTGTQLTTRETANGLGDTPAEKEQLFQLIGSLLTAYETETRRVGRSHDFAFALAIALAVNSSIFNGTPEPEEARLLEIGDAIGQLMAGAKPICRCS